MVLDVAAELAWLGNNPAFEQRPATVREFIGKNYLNIEHGLRQSILDELVAIMGEEVSGERATRYPLAMITGGIGIGKTTFASIILPYLAHWVLCLKDPQNFFSLLPGTRIAFMQMSTSEKQALDVVFGDIKARIDHSIWFLNNAQYDKKYTKQLKFPKDIWILPGDSHETTFEGYNILGGILDEADSHIVTDKADYAELGFDTIYNRITSRFQDRGFFVVIGQMKSNSGFASRKYTELEANPKAHVKRMSIWESMGDDFYRDSNGEIKKFAYDVKRHEIVPNLLAERVEGDNILWIPELYLPQFRTHPEKALKDLAGFPPAVGDPFISMVYKIEAARDRWIHNANAPFWGDVESCPPDQLIRTPVRVDGKIEDWFAAPNNLKRVAHIDIAYSAEGDALGFSMGHVRDLVTIDGEEKPYIVIDMMLRMKAPAGGEIMLQDIRHVAYSMRDHYKFRLVRVTMDGFQSTDTRQQLTKRRFESDIISVDKNLIPYSDLRDAIYEDRIEFPEYMVHLNPGDTKTVEIAVKELSELVDAGKKIDHPTNGSKDIADTLAAVVYTLMGDRTYRRRAVSLGIPQGVVRPAPTTQGSMHHPAVRDLSSMRAPLPPRH